MAEPITVGEGGQASAFVRGNRCAAAASRTLTSADRRWPDHRRFTVPRRSARPRFVVPAHPVGNEQVRSLWFGAVQSNSGDVAWTCRREVGTAIHRATPSDRNRPEPTPAARQRRTTSGGDVSASSDERPDRCPRCTPCVPAPVCRQTVLAACTGHRRSNPGKWTRDRDNR